VEAAGGFTVGGVQVFVNPATGAGFSYTSNSSTPGDIGTFNPNGGVGGDWGTSTYGAGTGTNRIYQRLNQNGIWATVGTGEVDLGSITGTAPSLTFTSYCKFNPSYANCPGLLGPATAPSGTCLYTGEWVLSQDFQITYCNGATWTTFSSGGSGTVNSGTTGQIGYYAGNGTAISGTSTLPNGTTAITQTQTDASTKVATTAYVDTGLATKQAAGTYITRIGKGATALNPGAITSATCATAVTVAVSGADPTSPNYDRAVASFTGDVTSTTGFAPVTTGGVTIFMWVSAGNINFRECNPTSTSITPGSVTVNWGVER
jgi:hypothetical protein